MPASEMRDLLLSSLAAGNVMSLAMGNQSGGWDSVGVTANETSTTTVLSGEARFVPFGFAAAKLLVVARDASNTLTLWVVDPQQDGVFVEPTPTMDQTRPMATVRFEQAAVTSDQLLASHADELVSDTLALSRILTVADQVGVAQASLDISVDYTKERSQFDRTIASFQAIKHKAADMMLKVESARSLLYYAACTVDAWLAGEVDRAALHEAAIWPAPVPAMRLLQRRQRHSNARWCGHY